MAAALVVAPLWLTNGAGATFPGAPGLVAFANVNVATTAVTGGPTTTLREGYLARWSPDGKRLLYVGHGFSLWTMNADGGNAKRLVRDGVREAGWSSDGGRILFEGGWPNDEALYTIAPDGRDKRVLFRQPGFFEDGAEWSPDGRRIAFIGHGSGSGKYRGLYTISPTGRALRHLIKTFPGSLDRVSWSPDSSKIAYVESAPPGANILDPRNGTVVAVLDVATHRKTTLAIPKRVDAETAAWSPDGRQLAVDGFDGDRTFLYLMNKDGSDFHRVRALPGLDFDWQPVH